MARPDATAACHGERITVHDGLGITELTLEVVGIPWDDDVLGLELELSRSEVEALRDRLTAWLKRGALR